MYFTLTRKKQNEAEHFFFLFATEGLRIRNNFQGELAESFYLRGRWKRRTDRKRKAPQIKFI